MKTTLTLSTSTTQGSIALGREGTVIQEKVWVKDKSHSEKITRYLQDLLKDSKVTLQDLDLLICSKGPGSFTGIRVGLSVIKTIAYAHKIPVIALDDCFSIAVNALDKNTVLPIAILLDAQKNKVFLGIYKIENNRLSVQYEPHLVRLEDLEATLTEPHYLCLGDGFDRFASVFSEDLRNKLQRDLNIADKPQASAIYTYVSQNLQKYAQISYSEVHPLYLRESAAEEVRAARLNKIITPRD